MEYNLLSDELVVKLLQVDDKLAFQEIYRRYFDQLFLLGMRKLNDRDIIKDCLQEIFMKLWERRREVTIENLEGYLKKALKYKIIDIYRQRIHTEEVGLAYLDDHHINSPSHGLSVSDIDLLLKQVLNEMPEKTASVFKLSRMEYKTTREISAKLNMPERTVEYHLSKAVKQLRILFKDYLLHLALFFWL